MKLSTQYAIGGALLAVSILILGWWTLLVLLFAGTGYAIGAHREGTFDLQAAFKALTGNTKTKSD